MLSKNFSQWVAPVVLASGLGFGSAAQAASVQSSYLIDGESVQSVSGIWTFNEKISVTQSGTYFLSLTDFDFLDQFDFVGAMITQGTDKKMEYTISEGYHENTSPIGMDLEEGDYWISLFAITDATSNGGTFRVNLADVNDISEVPAPPALVLMLTSLLGLGSFARRWQKRNK